MPRLFVGNFGFEHELAAGVPFVPSRTERRLIDELQFAWLAVADDGDAICLGESDDELPIPRSWSLHRQGMSRLSATSDGGEERLESGFLDETVRSGLPRIRFAPAARGPEWSLCPWGWASSMASMADSLQIAFDGPGLDAVRTANSRLLSFLLESKWGIGLPGAELCTSLDDVERAVRSCPPGPGRWRSVVKAEFGMAARERVLASGGTLHEPALRMLEDRLAADGAVFFEPWVDRLDEAGMQFTVPRRGEVRFEGIAPLLCDPQGQYAGSRFDPDTELERDYGEAIETGLRAARTIQQLGYFGPLGIDAMRYRTADGDVRLRSLQDINARWTMGRLSLGLRRLLRPGEAGVWRHVRWGLGNESPADWFARFESGLPPEARVVRMSPYSIDGRPTWMGTLAVFAPVDAVDRICRIDGR